MKQAADRIALPNLPDHGPEAQAITAKMLEMARTQIDSFA